MSAPVVRPYLVTLGDMSSTATALDDTYGWSWRAENNEAGYGEISLHHTDPLLDAIELPNSLVHYYVDDVLAFTVLLERWDSIDVAATAKELHTKFVGRGVGALFDRFVIDPSGGTGRLPIQEDRTFDYTAFEYDDGAWDNASEVCTVGDAQAEWPAGTTVGPTLWDPDFPDPTASVLWTSEGNTALADVGDRYIRQAVSVPTDGQYQFLVLGDNVGLAHFDNSLILTPGQASDSNYSGWTRATSYVLDLTAGDHIVAIKATNLGGPAGFAWALYPTDSDGVLGTLTAHSDTSATVLAATAPPGMTFGQDWEILFDETFARSTTALDAIQFVDWDFSATLDSDGNPWDEATISTKVGTSMLSFLREVSGTYIDFRFTVEFGMVVLHAYRKGEMGDTPSVAYHTRSDPNDAMTGNLVTLRRASEGPQGNRFLGRWGGGWAPRERQSSITAYGRWEAMLSIGAANDIAESNRLMDGQLDEFATPRVQTDASIEPMNNGDVPWKDYDPAGATVTLQGDAHRILAASCAVDDDTGHAHFALTLNDSVVLSPEERIAQVIGRLLRGSLGGRSNVVTAPIPRFIPVSIGIGDTVAAFFESFNKGDGAGWGPVLTWIGQGGSDMETLSGLGTSTDGTSGFATPDVDVFTNDQYVECVIAELSAPTSTDWGLSLRGRLSSRASYTGGTHYGLEIAYSFGDLSVRFRLFRFSALNSGGTQLATANTTLTVGDVCRLEIEGTALRGYKNGSLIVSATDATYAVGTGAVLGVANQGAHELSVDTFRFGDL